MDKTVIFVYFVYACNWTYEFYLLYNGYETDSLRAQMYYKDFKRNAGAKPLFEYGDQFYKEVTPDTYYFYIITPQYYELFVKEMKRLQMWDYKIYESDYAENGNYPGEARLKAFMFHTPVDFTHKTLEKSDE
jgi:hypothetical protein